MRRTLLVIVVVATPLLMGSATAGAAPQRPPQVAEAERPAVPVLSDDASWVRRAAIGLGGLLLAAAIVGPLYRRLVPEDEAPPMHSHDEPPGASHRHGAGGTVDFSAPERWKKPKPRAEEDG